ncbi:hypothetical protein GQ600_23130 [Phytophthora cactorum]|nr:hypothetical protein GQ600_23130 [Phytophthora cactorum]
MAVHIGGKHRTDSTGGWHEVKCISVTSTSSDENLTDSHFEAMAHFRIGPVRLIIPAMQAQEQAKRSTRSPSRGSSYAMPSIFPVEANTTSSASTSQRRQLTLHEVESLVVSGTPSRSSRHYVLHT